MMPTYLLCSLLSLCVSYVLSRSTGAPCEVLNDHNLTPKHDGVTPDTSPSPYKLVITDENGQEQEKPVVNKGKSYTVKIVSSEPLRGFLLRAVDTSGKDVGEFVKIPDCARIEKCDKGSYVTHKDKTDCPSPQFVWTSGPDTDKKGVRHIFRFQLSAVKDYETFWVNIKSRQFILLEDESNSAKPANPAPAPAVANPQTTSQTELPKTSEPKTPEATKPKVEETPEKIQAQPAVTTQHTAGNTGEPAEAAKPVGSVTVGKATVVQSKSAEIKGPKSTEKPAGNELKQVQEAEECPSTGPVDPTCGDGVEDGPDCGCQIEKDRAKSFCRIEGWPEYCPQSCCKR